MSFFSKLLNTLRQAVGLVLPVFAKAGDFRHWPVWVWRTLHVLLVVAIAVGLVLLQARLPSVQILLLERAPLWMRPYFLALLFLLLYALSWLGYWLWRLFGEEEEAADFPDVDAAWAEAVQKLDSAGIGLADAPLFLVLGRPAAGEDALFQASGQPITVRTPTAADAPLRVYAHRDAIFVTCAGASAWGQLADLLAGPDLPPALPEQPAAPALDKTIQFGSEGLGMAPELVDEMRELLARREQRDLTAQEQDRLRELAELSKGPRTAVKRRVALGADAQARGTARLRFLCRLIRRDRRPWCPINGLLVLVPWAATESDETAKEAAAVLQRDLAEARATLQLRYPAFALVCDLETAQGFAELRRGFPPETLKQRLGQRLPLVPDLPPAEAPALLERGVQWIGQAVLPAGIMRFLRLDGPGDSRRAPVSVGHNRNLYLLLREVYTRGPRLARVLARGLQTGGPDAADPLDALPLFGGCYLAGTGRQAAEQAFVPGVFQRLVDGQSSVSWTGAALAEDARYRRWTAYGYTGLAAAVVASLLLAALWTKSQQRPRGPAPANPSAQAGDGRGA